MSVTFNAKKMSVWLAIAISGIILWAGICRINNNSRNYEILEDFNQLCKDTAQVRVINRALWNNYIELAKKNVVRTDKKISLIEINSFSFSFGPNRSSMARSFPPGLHDEEVFITYNHKDIAILFVKVISIKGPDAITYYSCLSDGLDIFIQNEAM